MFSPLAGVEASAVAISESVQPTISTDKTPSGEIHVADDIAWQGEVEGTPGNVVSQEVGLEKVKQRLSRLIGVMTLFQLNAPMGKLTDPIE